MNKITTHGAASSKAHVLMGKLLKDSDYKKLMESKDIHEFIEYLVKSSGTLDKKVYDVPMEIDNRIARLKLESMGVKIDTLTKEQHEYLNSWTVGT